MITKNKQRYSNRILLIFFLDLFLSHVYARCIQLFEFFRKSIHLINSHFYYGTEDLNISSTHQCCLPYLFIEENIMECFISLLFDLVMRYLTRNRRRKFHFFIEKLLNCI